MPVDLYHLYSYYTDHSNVLRYIETCKDDNFYQLMRKEFTLDIDSSDIFFCVETGECFSYKDDAYQILKNEYTFIKLPNRNYLKDMKEFIMISQNPVMLSLLNISTPYDFGMSFGQCLDELDIEGIWLEYLYLKGKYELAKWLDDNNIEWTDNYAETPIDTHIDFTVEIKKRLEASNI